MSSSDRPNYLPYIPPSSSSSSTTSTTNHRSIQPRVISDTAAPNIGSRPSISPGHSGSGSASGRKRSGLTVEDEGEVLTEGEGEHGHHGSAGRRKRVKRTVGKACVYCRRSHMVCEGGRPCTRCVKREIAHLCRDVTPPPAQSHPPHHTTHHDPLAPTSDPSTSISDPQLTQVKLEPDLAPRSTSQLPTSLYSDPNFPPAWPLLPDTEGPVTYGDGSGLQRDVNNGTNPLGNGWGGSDDTELGALTKFLGDLGVPSLPGGFLDVLSYFSQKGSGNNSSGVPIPGVTGDTNGTVSQNQIESAPARADLPASSNTNPPRQDTAVIGNGRANDGSAGSTTQLAGISRIERYFLAAADQPSGPRASRLAQVIKAKYDAGMLKPYDYIKGYERMNKWMDSGRAAPRADSIAESRPTSPQKVDKNRVRLVSLTPAPASGSSISPDSRRRILAALNGFRPKFRQIARTLTDVDLVFVEEAMERWMLEYDRAFASIHTPSCIWRRTGEIQKANQEFANLTGIPASMFRNGQLCVYELMDEDSAVRYWEGYAKIAFDAGQRSLYTTCTLKVPHTLTRRRPHPSTTPGSTSTKAVPGSAHVPDLALPQPFISQQERGGLSPLTRRKQEEDNEIKCCFSVTIRRDAWGVPVAIVGQWIPI
ncbi:hypothetical protein BCR39DRAFT_545491 [Naematelia encephala]|uniref:Zn(2)-C6 fungal-type domain-containing protein n=1 Tax=Naematelia encephala TaxID=71784 RepID=A0A1Y2AS07_9TREE|nr:hypothetical protein BCR39DRAFT_545491 [Naematelia encephala]